jgi:NAD(P)-dependent dehydrogenase (short-subunit alcohol dehydrogenase family)
MQIGNHVFLVTGGASGLGAATARLLAAEGGSVVIADLDRLPARPSAICIAWSTAQASRPLKKSSVATGHIASTPSQKPSTSTSSELST